MGVSTHSLLVTTHYIGVFYSAGLILAGIIGFWVYRRKGCLYYLVGAIPGAATILFCLPFYLDQRTLGGSNSWIGRPSLSEFVVLYQYQINFHVFVLLGFATFILGARSRYSTTESTNSSPLISRSSPKQLAYRQAVLAVILVSISVPAFVWMESQVGMKLFVDRYFLPSFLLWPCIAAFVIAKFADYLSSTCGSVTSLRSGKLHFRNILKHSATTLLASLPFIVLIKDVRHVDETIGKVQERLVVLEHNNMPFASSNLQDVAALRHYSDHEKGEWVALPNDEFYAIRRAEKTVAHSLARRYWPGFVQTPNLLLDGRPSVIAPKMELESWITEGFISREGLVEESLGAGLSIIRKRP